MFQAMLRRLTFTLIGIAFVAYLIVFGREGVDAVLFFFPFTMIPYIVIGSLAWGWRSVGSQIVFLIATLAYSSWFAYVYLDATVWHPDPQSPIALLFVGIYAAPVLLLLWFIAYSLEWHARARPTNLSD